ncbi:MAG: TonB family protein, partial [Marinoscillum sp.]
YPGGVTKFYDYLLHNLIYPADAKKMKIEGRVFVQFIVERDGSLTEVKVVRGVHPSLDEEAVRVLKNSDNWIPGTQNGNPVRQKIIQNITFKLPGSNGNSTTAPPLEIGTKLRVPVHKEANPHKGVQGLKKYLKENKRELNTPLPPNENLNQVKLSFVIDTVGEIGDIEVIKSLGEERDQEAIRLFMEMPSWKPAEINDSPVAKRYEYSVDFNTIPEKDITAAIRLYRSAIENYSKGRKDSALDLLNKAIDKNPTALNFYFDRAAILIKMEDNLAACKDLEYIKDYDPQALSIYQQLCGKKE